MKRILFECENPKCKQQGISIYTVTIGIQKEVIPPQQNGDSKPALSPVTTDNFQVCSAPCALTLAEKAFHKTITQATKNEGIAKEL